MEKIDFVITWLDSTDRNWIKERNKYSKKKIDESRYRDWDLLKYWFRAIEKNAPWVNKIYFITYGHLPKWLNTDNNKIVIVNHKDYISKKNLPTFNSCVLENNFINIKDLSEKFVYFNDDTFINNLSSPEDFFILGKPLDNMNLEKIYFYGYNSTKINYNCSKIISKYFTIKKSKFKFNLKNFIKTIISFPKLPINGLVSSHMPVSYLKSTFQDVWNVEKNYLIKINNNKFRTDNDVSQWIFQYWQIASGNYIERNKKDFQYYTIGVDNIDEICRNIKEGINKLICLNDSEKTGHFEKNKSEILNAFKNRYSDKSKFEK